MVMISNRRIKILPLPLSRAHRLPLLQLVLLLSVVLVTGCEEKKISKKKLSPTKVVVAQVEEQNIPLIMNFPGTVRAFRQVAIVPRVSGFIFERDFEEGAFVKKDDLLYVIDPRPFQNKVASSAAQLQSDQASQQYWQEESDRSTRLAKAGAGSVEDKQKADSTLAEYKAAVAKDQADLKEAKLNLSYTQIRAPFRGRIDNTLFHLGALVTAEKSVLTSLVQLDPIYVIFQISRARMADIQKFQAEGMAPKGLKSFKTRISLPDGSTFAQEGSVDFMSNNIDRQTDSLTLRAIFKNPEQSEADLVLIPGQYVPVHLIAGEQTAALLIPQPALLRTQSGAHVLVVGADDKVESRPVTITVSYKESYVVSAGLKKGERVIVEGLQTALPGHPVEVVTGKSNTPPTSTSQH
jgi:RND family efflux transporter MFP subunit